MREEWVEEKKELATFCEVTSPTKVLVVAVVQMTLTASYFCSLALTAALTASTLNHSLPSLKRSGCTVQPYKNLDGSLSNSII